MKAVELFAGAGGLALGVGLAGFDPEVVIEWDKWACDTIRENQQRENPLVNDWPLVEGDVRLHDFSKIGDGVDLVSGGPPCQPFSLGGKHKAYFDKRDMFPTTIDVVRTLRPKAFLVENVKGLTRAAFVNYLQYIILQLTFPEVTINHTETWVDHLARLEKEKTRGQHSGLTYDVVCRVLNAANHGVPQRRERVFIVGFRHDIGARWSFPAETHSLDALLKSQWITGEYWDRHRVATKDRPAMEPRTKSRVSKLKGMDGVDLGKPWQTVRDGIAGLPDPRKARAAARFWNHSFQDGARAYPGHTGSPLDLPAKTLKAGDHGVPGGENMMVLPNGQVRYFTVREAARLQTFPDNYVFHGSWTETMRQLGNAVPVALARLMASSVAVKLLEAEQEMITATRGALH